MKLSCFRTCTFCSIFFCQVLRIAVQSLFLCLSVRRLMMWYICRCLKSVCLSLPLFNSAGESHSTGGSRENLNLRVYVREFSKVGDVWWWLSARCKHTHIRTPKCWSVHVSPVVDVVVPGEDICYSVSGPWSSFSKMQGCRGGEGSPTPPPHPHPPLLPNTISQALTSRSAAVCFKASN